MVQYGLAGSQKALCYINLVMSNIIIVILPMYYHLPRRSGRGRRHDLGAQEEQKTLGKEKKRKENVKKRWGGADIEGAIIKDACKSTQPLDI